MGDDIGDADRVALMQQLVQLTIEHRDLDSVIQRLAEIAGARRVAVDAAEAPQAAAQGPDRASRAADRPRHSGLGVLLHPPVDVLEADDVVFAE